MSALTVETLMERGHRKPTGNIRVLRTMIMGSLFGRTFDSNGSNWGEEQSYCEWLSKLPISISYFLGYSATYWIHRHLISNTLPLPPSSGPRSRSHTNIITIKLTHTIGL